ncbi:hypothetical protein KIPB_005775, partial [Kipferlia bialata]|eukprot:g5775.t1
MARASKKKPAARPAKRRKLPDGYERTGVPEDV